MLRGAEELFEVVSYLLNVITRLWKICSLRLATVFHSELPNSFNYIFNIYYEHFLEMTLGAARGAEQTERHQVVTKYVAYLRHRPTLRLPKGFCL